MVFVTAGMGGGTGTGSCASNCAHRRELGALTVGVVTKPFQFEGRSGMSQAEEGMREMKNAVDTPITIPNQRLLSVASRETLAPRILSEGRRRPAAGGTRHFGVGHDHGLINLDFADVRSIMAEMGMAMMGAASASAKIARWKRRSARSPARCSRTSRSRARAGC